MQEEPSTNFSLQGEKISKKKVVKTWGSLTNRRFPYGRIKAYVLDNFEMDKALEIARNSSNIKSVTVPEYGREVPLNTSTAAVTLIETRADNSKGWLIFIRKISQVSIQENLEHELNHIIKGDITLDGKAFGKKMEP